MAPARRAPGGFTERVHHPVRTAVVGAALLVGIALAGAPAFAEPPVPGATPSSEPTPSGDAHSHEHSPEPSPTPTPEHVHDNGHDEHAPPAEPTERPRVWVLGGFVAVNGVVLAYAAWLRRRTAPDRERRNAARAAAQAEGTNR